MSTWTTSLWTGRPVKCEVCEEAIWGAEEQVASEAGAERVRHSGGPPRAAGDEEDVQEAHRLPADPLCPYRARAMPAAALSQQLFVGADLGHGFLGEKSQEGLLST